LRPGRSVVTDTRVPESLRGSRSGRRGNGEPAVGRGFRRTMRGGWVRWCGGPRSSTGGGGTPMSRYEPDYVAYGYEFGSAASRLARLGEAVQIILRQPVGTPRRGGPENPLAVDSGRDHVRGQVLPSISRGQPAQRRAAATHPADDRRGRRERYAPPGGAVRQCVPDSGFSGGTQA
jgi:hypothetical protein